MTEIAGTTRDVVEEHIRLGNVTLRLSDTAGIRETEDVIEKIGVELAQKRLSEADLILAVFDATRALDDADMQILGQLPEKPVIAIVNKSDQENVLDVDQLRQRFAHVVVMAAKDGVGAGVAAAEGRRDVLSCAGDAGNGNCGKCASETVFRACERSKS